MLGLLILLLFYAAGAAVHHYLHVPLPGNVIGMLLLLAALALKLIKIQWVEKAATILLKHMMLFFAPLIVGTLAMTKLLAAYWLPLVAVTVLSTVITLVATAAVASLFGGPANE
jgi:holin-like protein